ncbi:MAG: M20/M25/M40 family metallo-hydrolase, partial [Bacteroidales bacterium]|nr:M20/M25/M40 family metallo-hydrolase [Bacteroidales bacterium]
MKKFTLTSLISYVIISFSGIFNLQAQEYDPFIQDRIDMLNYDSLLITLQEFEDLGIKDIYSQEIEETAQWIIDKYEYWGYENIQLDTFITSGQTLYNIVITKTGTLYPDEYIIIDGHYDTYNGPGVNDNGTGTAIVLEVARILKDIPTEYSIKFIHFSAEEMGLIGSSHYVQNVVIPEDLNIRLVFNIDEVGGVAGEVNNTITCERDESPPTSNNEASAAFTDTLASLTEMYSSLESYISYAYGSDYVPFMQNGYVVTGYYEYNESPYPHTIHDSLSNIDVDYVFEITKSSVGASLYFAHAFDPNTGVNPLTENSAIGVYPNPFEKSFEVKNPTEKDLIMTLFDTHGKELLQLKLG